MASVLLDVRADYPDLTFTEGEAFSWSPRKQTITYKPVRSQKVANWSLLHELAHALLSHHRYQSDFELLLLEVAAWDKARELATDYGIKIDEDHIQDCIDTYRDWLHQRSRCPSCNNTSLQHNSVIYKCFSCETSWTVTASRFCRPYRLTSKQQKTPSEALMSSGTTFLHSLVQK
jgi:ribosomal protein L37AE/L43A